MVQMIAALTFCTLLHLRAGAGVHSGARVPPTYHSRPFTGLFCNSYSNIYYRSSALRDYVSQLWLNSVFTGGLPTMTAREEKGFAV